MVMPQPAARGSIGRGLRAMAPRAELHAPRRARLRPKSWARLTDEPTPKHLFNYRLEPEMLLHHAAGRRPSSTIRSRSRCFYIVVCCLRLALILLLSREYWSFLYKSEREHMRCAIMCIIASRALVLQCNCTLVKRIVHFYRINPVIYGQNRFGHCINYISRIPYTK